MLDERTKMDPNWQDQHLKKWEEPNRSCWLETCNGDKTFEKQAAKTYKKSTQAASLQKCCEHCECEIINIT